ncbi:MAG: septum formation initiator family protein [Candidatus Magasanikbacteria bacterium]|nr:septum formation initiator family protein [Candidatus Magasanikbacteria bacterium]
MLNRRKKQFISDLISHPLTLTIIGVIILSAICFPLVKNIKKQYAINSEINELHKEIAEHEAKNINLKDKFKYLESDQFANEQAKINLNYKKEGEEVVVIKSLATNKTEDTNSNNKNNPGNTDNNNEEKRANPVLWWRYFFY